MIQAHYIYCTLYFCYYYIRFIPDHRALDPGVWKSLDFIHHNDFILTLSIPSKIVFPNCISQVQGEGRIWLPTYLFGVHIQFQTTIYTSFSVFALVFPPGFQYHLRDLLGLKSKPVPGDQWTALNCCCCNRQAESQRNRKWGWGSSFWVTCESSKKQPSLTCL